ncbi:class A beta-lactamase [Aeromicrobium sp. CF4.19]|uniref:class A beta-lactamase n=1 Tax=Aeromicrobium sp. CF4.19 TaxID=3373082 RepID=UPI003EE640FF
MAIILATILVLAGCSQSIDGADDPAPQDDLTTRLEQLEAKHDARIGVSLIDVDEDVTLGFNEDERFGFASTMKAYAAAALLDATSAEERAELVRWTSDDVAAAGYSPVTERSVDTGLSLEELAEAAVRESDNTAMNLVLRRLGGPEGLAAALRNAGDSTSQPVDIEPGLNDVVRGEEANTSTAAALAANLERIITGEWLAADDRALFLDWMSGNATGDTLVRAGAPAEWEVAEKSGGAGPMRNDVAILQPPRGGPIVLVVLTERNDPEDTYDDVLIEDVTRAVLSQYF